MKKAYIPLAAGLPGVLGLIPFFAAMGLFLWGRPNQAGVALLTLLAWSAVSLSFLGGARWGHESARPEPRLAVMAASGLPVIAGWLILATPLDTTKQLGAFIAGFVALWLWDVISRDLPPWQAKLRTFLTLGVVIALGLSLWKATQG
jgi:hypothetical protein